MSKANLLIHIESFSWDILTVNRTTELNDLAIVINAIKNKEDVIYSHPDTYLIKLSWGDLYKILSFDEETRRMSCSWLSHDHQKTLIKLFSHSISKRPSYNINDLDEEFVNGINGMLGIDSTVANKYVYNQSSYDALRAYYLKPEPEIFRHALIVPGNEINGLIVRNQTHPIFKRLDLPKQIEDQKTLHGEQIQIHFNDKNKSCLNIDGTWKHGSFIIPEEVKEILRAWGFSLPNEK